MRGGVELYGAVKVTHPYHGDEEGNGLSPTRKWWSVCVPQAEGLWVRIWREGAVRLSKKGRFPFRRDSAFGRHNNHPWQKVHSHSQVVVDVELT